MRVSLRRTLRVGDRAGQPVEDLGVMRDEAHRMTRDDLLNSNRDLLNRAGALLAAGTPRRLDATTSVQGQKLHFEVTTLNVDQIDLVPTSDEVQRALNEMERRYPDGKTLANEIDHWYMV